jgi:PadR family transcriptional regulator AphA
MVASGKEPSRLGPARIPLWATPEGCRAAEGWLRQPACHARDVRSELLLKLALLDWAGADPRELLRAQRRQLAPVADALAGRIPATPGGGLHY